MPLTRTLLQARIDLAAQCGIEIDAVGGTIPRHTTVNVNLVLNQAHRSLRAYVTSLGYKHYKLATAHASLPIAATVSGESYAQVAWPSDAIDILGIDIASSATAQDWVPLEYVEWECRRDFTPSSSFFGNGYLGPYAWSPITAGSVNAAAFTAGIIAVFPMPSGGLYKIWYLPQWVDITTDAHLFLGHDEDWFQWMYWCGAQRLVSRDNGDKAVLLDEAERQLNPLGADGKPNKATAAGRILAAAPRHVKAGPRTWTRSFDYWS